MSSDDTAATHRTYFAERRENYRRLFESLDVAVAANDPSQTVLVCDAMIDLAGTSPYEPPANLESILGLR